MRTHVSLHMITFRPIHERENAPGFFAILESSGEIYVPEFIEPNGKIRYVAGEYESLSQFWTPLGFGIQRRHPFEVVGYLSISPEEVRKSVPNSFYLSIQKSYFSSSASLMEVVNLGSRLYHFLRPCYGFIILPWQDELRAARRPDLGLPGIGWATWLGPEYADSMSLPGVGNLTPAIRRMDDGGCLVICGWPNKADTQDSSIDAICQQVMRRIDPAVLQPKEGKAPRVPRFRYVTERDQGRPLETENRSKIKGGYGPKGFTRTSEVRAILDDLEPDFIGDGVPNGIGGSVYFSGLTAENAKRLVELLPPGQAGDSLEDSPTFSEMVALGDRLPRIQYFGYRIVPESEGECITIEGFSLPEEDATPNIVAEIKSYKPDKVVWLEGGDGKVLVAEWD